VEVLDRMVGVELVGRRVGSAAALADLGAGVVLGAVDV
jgi:hypothetical protein